MRFCKAKSTRVAKRKPGVYVASSPAMRNRILFSVLLPALGLGIGPAVLSVDTRQALFRVGPFKCTAMTENRPSLLLAGRTGSEVLPTACAGASVTTKGERAPLSCARCQRYEAAMIVTCRRLSLTQPRKRMEARCRSADRRGRFQEADEGDARPIAGRASPLVSSELGTAKPACAAQYLASVR